MSVKLNNGDNAPDFTLKGDDEKEYSLSDFKGSRVILYFYPKDNTPGCTREAVAFNEALDKFAEKGAKIIGVSPDSIGSHTKFKDKYSLSFLLLSDPEKKCAEAYGAYGEKTLYGKKSMGIIRSTFLIDENGVIADRFYNVKVDGHCDAVFKKL